MGISLKIKGKDYNLKRVQMIMVSITQIVNIAIIILFIILGLKLAKKIFWGLAFVALIIFLLLTFVF